MTSNNKPETKTMNSVEKNSIEYKLQVDYARKTVASNFDQIKSSAFRISADVNDGKIKYTKQEVKQLRALIEQGSKEVQVIKNMLLVPNKGALPIGPIGPKKISKKDQLIKDLQNEVAELKLMVGHLIEENKQLRAENAELRAENAQLRAEIAELRAENAELRAENAELRVYIGKLESKLDQHVPNWRME
ncbi:hypothetical protein [Williamsoniiplasma lucivorax]|uniref:Uncharacterized protein n=2 Tax=Williamsoniiplasma lucivorax TaxID=209274 RepID=A0A2S5R9Z4_9MOLU|nr:hypothetical protein [Williamsoniiplasma lucivorax]PPE04128.1 hypothetical protein ELUCI_v1c09080 [Williamsoniiplasma lucivorax]